MWGREERRGAGWEGEEDPERRQVHSTVEPLKVGQGGREGEGEKAKRERERRWEGRSRTLSAMENSGRVLRTLAFAATALLNLSCWWCGPMVVHREGEERRGARARENSLEDIDSGEGS